MGALYHIAQYDIFMFNIEDINEPVNGTVGVMTTMKKGSKKVLVKWLMVVVYAWNSFL